MLDVLQALAQGLTLLLPILVAGIAFIVAIKKRWMVSLDKPVDFGRSLGGKRIFGDNKNWRGVFIYLALTPLVTWLIHLTAAGSPWVSSVYKSEPITLGLASASAYVCGELLNSFVKRRLGVAPGKGGGRIQAFFDNADGMLASGLVIGIVYQVPPLQLAIAAVASIAVHATTDAVMRRIGLKRGLER